MRRPSSEAQVSGLASMPLLRGTLTGLEVSVATVRNLVAEYHSTRLATNVTISS